MVLKCQRWMARQRVQQPLSVCCYIPLEKQTTQNICFLFFTKTGSSPVIYFTSSSCAAKNPISEVCEIMFNNCQQLEGSYKINMIKPCFVLRSVKKKHHCVAFQKSDHLKGSSVTMSTTSLRLPTILQWISSRVPQNPWCDPRRLDIRCPPDIKSAGRLGPLCHLKTNVWNS